VPRFIVVPVPKPRMTRSDRWNQRPAVTRYWAFKDELQRQATLANFELGECFMAIFHIPMPQSWSAAKKRQMLGQPHKQRPDNSNYVKAIEDSLLPDDDSKIWFTAAAKFWATEGAIEINNFDPYEARFVLCLNSMKSPVSR